MKKKRKKNQNRTFIISTVALITNRRGNVSLRIISHGYRIRRGFIFFAILESFIVDNSLWHLMQTTNSPERVTGELGLPLLFYRAIIYILHVLLLSSIYKLYAQTK